jgi:small-conductance mechanosensitive channel
VIYLLAIGLCIYVIPETRSLSASILAGSGVLAIIIGFASQQAFSNIVSGIFIALFKPIRIGDKIKLVGKDISGVVEDLTLRHIIVRNFENKRVIIPNSIMSSEIIENAHIVEEKVCRFFDIGISYNSNIDIALGIIMDEIQNHPDYFDNRTKEEKANGVAPAIARVLGFGESSVNLRGWVWAKDNPTGFQMHCDLNRSIKQRFDREGIEIPFPHRTVLFKEPLSKKI